MSNLSEELGHIKNHVKYPATKNQLIETCNNMSDVPSDDRNWFNRSISDKTYNSANEVVSELLNKV